MPDPLTALGAAAAASQFVSQGLKITIYFYQAFQKIKDAPENIRKALAEVEQLISISKLIIQNESLQTESIASTLGICLRDITKLESILRKVSPGEDASKSEKFRKAVVATFKEDAITKLLASLDREKMNLSLCMHEINSSLLGSIGIQLQGAQTTAGELLLVVNDSARNVQTVVDVLPGIAEQVTTIHDTFPDMSSKLSMISTDLLPAIISLIQAKHEEMMSVLVGSSKIGGYFNVPNRLSRNFVGRDDVLQQLHHICGQDRQCSTTIVLRALGGQGKSQVAMRFCQQTRGSTFVSTLWIDASSNLSIRKEFQMFNASSQNPSSNNMDSMDAIAACTRDIFERMNEPCLIVLDNLDDPGNISLIRDCIPLSKLGVVLITSRHADAVVLASPKCSIELAPLPDVTASELLLVAANCDADTSSSTTVALEISSKLSYNPLAIAQAGAYFKRRRLSLSEFLDQYNRHLKIVLSQNHLPLSEYQRRLDDQEKATSLSVFATWELSLAQLKEEQTCEKMYKEDLLNLLGFSHSTNVSEDTFSVFCTNIHPWGSVDEMKTAPGSFLAEHLGHWNSEMYVEMLDEFCDLSLIQKYYRREDGFYQALMHSLIKDWIVLRAPEYQNTEYRILTMEIMIESMESLKQQSSKISAVDDVAGLQKVLELSSVAECKCPPEGNDNRRNDQIKQLLLTQNALLETMFQVGRYQQVVRVGKLLLSSNRDIFGETSLEIVVIGSRLAEALCLTNKYAEAETLAQNILTQSISLNGPKSGMSQFIIKIIAKSLRGMERHDEALNFCEQFVDLRDDEPISHDIESLRATINSLELANVFGIRNQQDIIAKCLKIRAVLNSFAEAHDRGRQLLGQCALILGNGYSKVARQELAVEEFRCAWQIYRKELGDCHPETLYCLAHLASALTRSEDYEESEQCHREADKLLSAALEIDNSAALSNSFSWGSCLWEQKKLDQAAEKYRYTYDGSIRVLGIESPNTLTAMQGLAFVLCDKGLEAQARDIVRQHFKGFREQFTEAQLKEKIEETLKGHIDES